MNVGLQNISQFGTLSQTIGLIRTQKHPRVIEIDSTNISHQILQKKIFFCFILDIAKKLFFEKKGMVFCYQNCSDLL